MLSKSVSQQLSFERMSWYSPYVVLGFLLIANLLLLWPGQTTSDSMVQYREALSGQFNDHHPPLMAFVWRILLFFISGTGSMLLLHLGMLYAAMGIMISCFRDRFVRWYFVLMPLFPSLFFYSSVIWKDVGFAFAYLLSSAIILNACRHRATPSALQSALLLMALFYGTAVKFQALYVAPVMLLAVAYIQTQFRLSVSTVLRAFLYYVLFYAAIVGLHLALVNTSNAHSWKFVKMYDLAGMSLLLNKPLLPEYILNAPQYSFDAVKERFNYERVDDIVFFPDSPIPRVETDQERRQLLMAWYRAVLMHPIAYLQHRYRNWRRILFAKPLEKLETLDFSQFKGLGWFARLQQASLRPERSFEHYLGSAIFTMLYSVRYVLSFFFILLFALGYLLLGLVYRKEPLGLALAIVSGTALALVGVLFMFSMASCLRYVYASVCLVYLVHPVAYAVWTTRRGRSVNDRDMIAE